MISHEKHITSHRVDLIRNRLTETLSPNKLEIIDESYLHAGHAGAQTGAGHFKLIITSPLFQGKNRIEQHKLIYQTLGDLMKTDIHALTIIIE